MMGCGPGGTCCGSCRSGGLGEAVLSPPVPVGTPFPTTTQVIYDYVMAQLAAGRPFYISPELNTRTLTGDGFGFIAAILAAATAVASTIGNIAGPIASIAALTSSTGGGGAKGANPTADDIAAAIMPQVVGQLQAQGISLPAGVAQTAVGASLLDAFGTQNRGLVMAGAAGIGLLLLFKLLKR